MEREIEENIEKEAGIDFQIYNFICLFVYLFICLFVYLFGSGKRNRGEYRERSWS